jgi:serine/threonine-protein kinase
MTAPDNPLIGHHFGHYVALSLLGKGGMGAVYLAEQPRIGKRVAIKVLNPPYANDPAALRRFFHEAQLVNRIGHENIIDVLDFAEDEGGLPYLVMELLEGEPLGARLRRGRLDEGTARRIGAQVARALAAAHAISVVHRDLKPDNVFLCRRGSQADFVKLLDFGIAKLGGELGARERLTRTGSLIGTPLYISPEQIEGRPVDARTDVYALGCILFEMVVGRPPFLPTPGPEALPSLFAGHLREPPPSLTALAPGISPGYAALVSACLAKAPSDRPASADLVAAVLERAPAIAERVPKTQAAPAVEGRAAASRPTALAQTLAAASSEPAPAAVSPVATAAPVAGRSTGQSSTVPARSRRTLFIAAAAGGGVTVLAVIVFAIVSSGSSTGTPVRPPAAPRPLSKAPPPARPAPPARPVPPAPAPVVLPPVAPEPAAANPPSAPASPSPAELGAQGVVTTWWLVRTNCTVPLASVVTVRTSGTQLTSEAPGAPPSVGTTDAMGNYTMANAFATCSGHSDGNRARQTCQFANGYSCWSVYRRTQ